MFTRFYEEIRVGEQQQLGEHLFTAEEIKTFATRWDPQPFHTDETCAAASHFGALCASGWHTAAVCQRLAIAFRERQLAATAPLAGRPQPRLGPSPGFRDLQWLRPVYAGDTVSFASRVIAKRDLRSRPAWGLVTGRCEGRNQDGVQVYSVDNDYFLERLQQ